MNTDIAKKSKKRVMLTFALPTLILFALSSFLIKPLYIGASSDVIYTDTVLVPILEILITIVDNLAYAVCFAGIIYSIFKFTLKKSFGAISVSFGIFFFKYLSAFVMDSLSYGYIETTDILLNLLYLAIDTVKLLLIVFLSNGAIKRYYKNRAESEKAHAVLGKRLVGIKEELFDKKAILSFSNPLHCSAFISAIVILSTEIISETRYYIVMGFFNSFASAMWMLTDYISDIIIATVIYALSLLIFSHFYKKDA